MAGIEIKKVEASTLVEVLISMVVIMAVFSVAIGIFTNVVTSGLSMNSLDVEHEINNLMLDLKADEALQTPDQLIDSVLYKKQITVYDKYPGLSQIDVLATRNGREVGHARKIVRTRIPQVNR